MPYEIIEHTADLKIRVRGNSLEDLFREAVLAMAEIIKPGVRDKAGEEREAEIEASDITALLVDFLNEVLALSQTNKEIYKKINFKKLSEKELEVTLEGVEVGGFKEDIKAVTYHEAEVKRNEKGEWETVIVFDI